RRSVKWPEASFAKLERQSAMPSMAPSQTGPAPMAARNPGSRAFAVSWLQSQKRLVSPTPRTVRLSHDCCFCVSAIEGESTVDSLQFTVIEKAKIRSRWKSGSMVSMRPRFQRVTFLLVVLLAFALTISSEPPKAPFSLSLVPTNSSGEGGSITMAQSKARDLYVVLTNVSKDPQPV